jgi:hypothetical protein
MIELPLLVCQTCVNFRKVETAQLYREAILKRYVYCRRFGTKNYKEVICGTVFCDGFKSKLFETGEQIFLTAEMML